MKSLFFKYIITCDLSIQISNHNAANQIVKTVHIKLVG